MRISKLVLAWAALVSTVGFSKTKAFQVYGKETTVEEITKEDQASFYEIEKKKYQLVERIAKERYLEQFWQKKAAAQKVSTEKAQKDYFDKNVKVSDAQVKEFWEKYKDDPQLSKLPKEEQQSRIRDYLKGIEIRGLVEQIVESGITSGDLKIIYPKPADPVYNVVVTDKDHVRYGPGLDDIKPLKNGCKGDSCPITIVEYSEFECPYCARVMPKVHQVLENYKGRLRWVMRDFPLSFHARAKPAAVAAKCAGQQGKYWHMYAKLFENQLNLQDKDLIKYAKEIKVYNDKWKGCFENQGPMLAEVEANFQSGQKLGVSGTPAFFINGRRLSGNLPYAEFKRVIEEELAKKKQKS